MKRLVSLLAGLKEFDENTDKYILAVVKSNEKDIVKYVSEIQLFIEGIRGSDGAFIAGYNPYHYRTVEIKQEKGQPTDRVTLRDTGEFHKSFTITFSDESFRIVATDWKTDFLVAKYGDGVLALSDEHLHSLKVAIIKPQLISTLKQLINA